MNGLLAEASEDRKPFLAHLEDLRVVLLRSAAALLVAMGIALVYTPEILGLLKAPLHGVVTDPDTFLRSIEVAGAFTATLRIAFWSGVVLAAPFLVIFIGAYLVPALTASERRAVSGVGVLSVILFVAGVAMGYFFTLPFALRAMFLMHGWLGVVAEWTLTSYVLFATQLLVAFGLAFELPVVILVLGRLGIISSTWLRTYRRHAIIVILLLATVLTPPDVFSQLLMAIPLAALYEACVWIIWSWERAAQRAREEDGA
ncbi:MAG TPA: twin-arginine translocase subunit TatC [Kiritimatiellia bacterium]|nr:twin-arginine translocase subunit TatC [Kiritimatiellia bacterium]